MPLDVSQQEFSTPARRKELLRRYAVGGTLYSIDHCYEVMLLMIMIAEVTVEKGVPYPLYHPALISECSALRAHDRRPLWNRDRESLK